jgi:hypothetical protein
LLAHVGNKSIMHFESLRWFPWLLLLLLLLL